MSAAPGRPKQARTEAAGEGSFVSAYDLIVVGGGPAGYVGAIRAAQLGLRTALVERADLGGICLNWGCIPAKALLHSADVLRTCRNAAQAGIRMEGATADLAQIVAGSRAAAARLGAGVRHLLGKHGVTVHTGHARLNGAGVVDVEGPGAQRLSLTAPSTLLATGARGRTFPGLVAPDPARIWGYREALTPTALPASLLVIGAGAIGMEFASFYATLGVQVQVCELQQHVLPGEDRDISAFVRAAFERDGIRVRTGCAVRALHAMPGGVRVQLEHAGKAESVMVERVLVSIGVAGNVEDIGLQSTPRVKAVGGFISVDAFGATGEPGIYAAGDVTGAPWLAHRASHQAVACVEKIAGFPGAHAPEPDRIPSCTFCHPQVASVGLTEAAARAGGRRVKVGSFSFAGNGKAVATGLGNGLVKTLFDESTGALLGAHMVGEGVTEMIHGFAIALQLETTEEELMQVVFAHPTVSETLHESVLAAFGRALHA